MRSPCSVFLARQIGMERKGVTARLISNQVLLNDINRLRQDDKGAANILQARFLNQESSSAGGASKFVWNLPPTQSFLESPKNWPKSKL